MDQAVAEIMPLNLPPLFHCAAHFERADGNGSGIHLDQYSLEPISADPEYSSGRASAPGDSIPDEVFPTNPRIIDYAQASEEELVAAAKSSDHKAFVELSERCRNSVDKKVYRIVRNREDSEDVVQDALLKAYCHLPEFRGSSGFSTWLTRIAINTAFTLLRKRKSHPEVSNDQCGDADQPGTAWEFPDPSPDAEQEYARKRTVEVLSHAVKRLRPKDRNTLELFHIQEMSMKQIADSLGITVSSAKSRLHRARLAVRSTLERKQISMSDVCY